jgi:hypothetical protein
MHWIGVTQEKDRWQTVNAVMNFEFHKVPGIS